MKAASPTGLFDILPRDQKEPWREGHVWRHVEAAIHDVTSFYGFEEIRTPIFERTELFEKGTGADTDIVTKEMYTFEDRGNRSMTLRPEGTPPVMRAFVEHQLQNLGYIQKLFYIGPMFRYERPQAGRYRQHHQFGAEVVGVKGPEQDAELIDMLMTLYNKLGLKGVKVMLNSLGDEESRGAFRYALKRYLDPYAKDLSEDSQRRLETNPLRILDSKHPADQEIITDAPTILDFLDTDSRAHFEEVQRLLTDINVPYEISPRLVRGLDYYNKTVFEVVSSSLGAQNAIGGGGRFDGLLKTLGGPDLPSIGFATGLERVIQSILAEKAEITEAKRATVTLIPIGDAAREAGFRLIKQLREKGVRSVMDFTGRKIAKAMNSANQSGVPYVVVLGDEEVESGIVKVKDMATGEEEVITMDGLSTYLFVRTDDATNPANIGNQLTDAVNQLMGGDIGNQLKGLGDLFGDGGLGGLGDIFGGGKPKGPTDDKPPADGGHTDLN